MKKLFEWITKHSRFILTVYLLLAVLCIPCWKMVGVNYDLNDYLPADSPSTQAIDVMQSEFEGSIPNARVMVNNVTIPEALDYKEKLSRVKGVEEVLWLDDTADIHIPLAMQDEDTVETYYKEGNALFVLTISEGEEVDAVREIRSIIGEDNALTGAAVSTAVAVSGTVTEIGLVTAIGVIFTLIVLIFTTSSWIHPILILFGIGIALVINSGTNLIFGDISFVTNSAGSILQLAVSLDYSVFLLHRFEHCLEMERNPKQAMANALSQSLGSIFSSGVTTVIGFLALVFMRFQLGPDMGLALAKGIVISLLAVFTLFPSMVLLAMPLLEKTKHRPLLPKMDRVGKAVSRMMLPGVLIFAVILAPAYLAQNRNDFYYGASHIYGPGTVLGDDTQKIEAVFGKSDTYVLMVPRGNLELETSLSQALHRLPEVTDIISFVDKAGAEVPLEYLEEETLSKLMSEHYSRFVLSVETDMESEQTAKLVNEIRSTAQGFYPETYLLAGEGVSTCDLRDTVTEDMVKVNAIAIGAVFLVLLIALRKAILPVLLVLSIETAIWLNLAIPYFTDSTVFYIAYLLISSIQLGATVDYAILMTDTYREKRLELGKKAAVQETVSNCLVSILTSGSVMAIVGLAMGHFSHHGIIKQLGTFLGRGTMLSLLIVLFVLPGLLYLFDRYLTHKKEN